MDHAWNLKFSSCIHLPSVNKMFQYRYACVMLYSVGEVIILEDGAIFQLWNMLGC